MDSESRLLHFDRDYRKLWKMAIKSVIDDIKIRKDTILNQRIEGFKSCVKSGAVVINDNHEFYIDESKLTQGNHSLFQSGGMPSGKVLGITALGIGGLAIDPVITTIISIGSALAYRYITKKEEITIKMEEFINIQQVDAILDKQITGHTTLHDQKIIDTCQKIVTGVSLEKETPNWVNPDQKGTPPKKGEIKKCNELLSQQIKRLKNENNKLSQSSQQNYAIQLFFKSGFNLGGIAEDVPDRPIIQIPTLIGKKSDWCGTSCYNEGFLGTKHANDSILLSTELAEALDNYKQNSSTVTPPIYMIVWNAGQEHAYLMVIAQDSDGKSYTYSMDFMDSVPDSDPRFPKYFKIIHGKWKGGKKTQNPQTTRLSVDLDENNEPVYNHTTIANYPLCTGGILNSPISRKYQQFLWGRKGGLDTDDKILFLNNILDMGFFTEELATNLLSRICQSSSYVCKYISNDDADFVANTIQIGTSNFYSYLPDFYNKIRYASLTQVNLPKPEGPNGKVYNCLSMINYLMGEPLNVSDIRCSNLKVIETRLEQVKKTFGGSNNKMNILKNYLLTLLLQPVNRTGEGYQLITRKKSWGSIISQDSFSIDDIKAIFMCMKNYTINLDNLNNILDSSANKFRYEYDINEVNKQNYPNDKSTSPVDDDKSTSPVDDDDDDDCERITHPSTCNSKKYPNCKWDIARDRGKKCYKYK